jgi:Cut12 conserved domain
MCSIHYANHILDGDETTDLPDTPAPVFAARALKSAIFGAPDPQEDETFYEGESESEDIALQNTAKGMSRSMSPTKPQGILLTPGTGTTRRKTVSFGHEVVDKPENEKTRGKVSSKKSKTGIPDDCPGKFPSPWTSKSEPPRRVKRNLTKVLEDAREGKISKDGTESRVAFDSQPIVHPESDSESKPSKPEIKRPSKAGSDRKPSESSKPSKSEPSNQELLQELMVHENYDNDMTVDLNEPHSQSGKFWKSNFEQYHKDAKAEMAKLMKYKQLAKSYAKLKDVQSINLEEKLKEEQRKVLCMEDQISKLTAQIAVAAQDGNDNASPELTRELARQTALAIQYKDQVEEFRLALEGPKGEAGVSANQGKRLTAERVEETIGDVCRELRNAREQLKEMVSLREEMRQVRQTLSTTEKTVAKLQEENTKLSQELLHADLRLENHLEKCEKKRQSSEERIRLRNEEIQTLHKDYTALKDLAKANRRDAEQLLKGRHDQVVKLRKEIASLRGAESTAQEFERTLQKKTAEHDRVVADLQRQIATLKENQKQEPIDFRALGRTKDEKQQKDLSTKPLPSIQPQDIESQISIPSPPIARPARAAAPSKHSRSDTPSKSPRRRSSHSALSEIVNNASVDSIPPPRYGLVQHTPLPAVTPLADRLSSTSLSSPEMQLPSLEPSLSQITGKPIHERNCRASPRPSMFNIAASPPKAAVVRSQTSGELSRQRSHNDIAARRLQNFSSSRVSSLDGSKQRVALPPERAAAARARLEQKNAEKKRAQELVGERNKENIRN